LRNNFHGAWSLEPALVASANHEQAADCGADGFIAKEAVCFQGAYGLSGPHRAPKAPLDGVRLALTTTKFQIG